MPASPPPSVLPSRPSPSRPADASTGFVLSDTSAADFEGPEGDVSVDRNEGHSPSPVGSGDLSGADAESQPEEEVGSSSGDLPASGHFSGAESPKKSEPHHSDSPSLPSATGRSTSNPLPELEWVGPGPSKQSQIPEGPAPKFTTPVEDSTLRTAPVVQRHGAIQGGVQQISSGRMLSASAVLSDAHAVAPHSGAAASSVSSGSLGSRPLAEVPLSQEQGASAERGGVVPSAASRAADAVASPTGKVSSAEVPQSSRNAGQVDVDLMALARPDRTQGDAVRHQVVPVEQNSREAADPKSTPVREAAGSTPPPVDPALPAREGVADPVRVVQQAGSSSWAKPTSPSQAADLMGSSAGGAEGAASEDVPVSVNLTRRALRSLGRGHGGATVVQLRPAQFGKVTVRVQLEEGRVQADLVARTPEAARVLGEHLRLLRDSLEHKGLVVDRLEVREESKAESSRATQDRQSDADSDQSGAERDHHDGDAPSDQRASASRVRSGGWSDEFDRLLMAAEEQA